MQQSPSSDADISSPSQAMCHNLCNPKVHYRAHNSQPLARPHSEPDQSSPLLPNPTNFNALPFTPMSTKWSVTDRIPRCPSQD
jgi:hypothetical protein